MELLRQARDLRRTVGGACAYVPAVPSVRTLLIPCRVAGDAVRESPSSLLACAELRRGLVPYNVQVSES